MEQPGHRHAPVAERRAGGGLPGSRLFPGSEAPIAWWRQWWYSSRSGRDAEERQQPMSLIFHRGGGRLAWRTAVAVLAAAAAMLTARPVRATTLLVGDPNRIQWFDASPNPTDLG